MVKNMKKNSPKYIGTLFLTALIWGFAFAFQNIGGDSLGAFWFNGIRFFLGVLSLIPVILIFEREKMRGEKFKKTVWLGALCGVILFAASSLQQYGILLTDSAGKAGFITGLYMVFVPLCGLFMHQKIRPEAWIGAVVAVIGLYFVSFANGIEPAGVGDLVLVIGSFFWTAHIVVIDRYAAKVSPLKFSMVQFLVCGLLCVVCALFTEEITMEAVIEAKIPVLYCGIMSVGVAYTCQVIGQRGTEPALASIILCTESVFAAIGGWLLLHEYMGWRGYMGCALIFCGIILSQVKIWKGDKSNERDSNQQRA